MPLKVIRTERRPNARTCRRAICLITIQSGVRMNWYRDDLEEHQKPWSISQYCVKNCGCMTISEKQIGKDWEGMWEAISSWGSWQERRQAGDPVAGRSVYTHDFAPTAITRWSRWAPALRDGVEQGDGRLCTICDSGDHGGGPQLRCFMGRMSEVDSVECFAKPQHWQQKFGHDRVFNTPIQEAFIIGSTVGMSAVGPETNCGSSVCRLYLARPQSTVYRSEPLVLSLKWEMAGEHGYCVCQLGRIWQRWSLPLLECRISRLQYSRDQGSLSKQWRRPEKGWWRPHITIRIQSSCLSTRGSIGQRFPEQKQQENIEPSSDYVIPLGKGRSGCIGSQHMPNDESHCCDYHLWDGKSTGR